MWIYLALTTPQMPFYFTTLEEYYTGGLFLGPCNGVTDGSIVLIAVFLFTAVVGNSWWTSTFMLGNLELSYSKALLLCLLTI